MSTSSVQVETRGAVALVTLNRPDSSNTLNLEMAMDLLAAAMTCVDQVGPLHAETGEVWLLHPETCEPLARLKGLTARPIVVAPDSVVDLDLIGEDQPGVLACDWRRSIDIPPGGRVTVRRGVAPVRIVRIHDWSFGERLVTKFQLPVRGFRDGSPDPTG